MLSVTPLVLAATVALPVAEVKEVVDLQMSVYPGRVTPIALVDVVPQGRILGYVYRIGGSFR